jgi:putative transposase
MSVLTGEIAVRVQELAREICKSKDVGILKGHISQDHIQLDQIFRVGFASIT